nr:MAG TPA: hypothetical protein [Bacteriophage sp.]
MKLSLIGTGDCLRIILELFLIMRKIILSRTKTIL